MLNILSEDLDLEAHNVEMSTETAIKKVSWKTTRKQIEMSSLGAQKTLKEGPKITAKSPVLQGGPEVSRWSPGAPEVPKWSPRCQNGAPSPPNGNCEELRGWRQRA